MPQAAQIRWNSFFSLLSAGIQLLTNALLFLGVARFYGLEVFGQFTTAHLLATLFLTIADFGLDVLLTTEVARQPSEAASLLRRFFSTKLALSIFAIAGMCGITLVHDFSDGARRLIYIFSFSVAFTALTNFFFALFKGFEQLQHQTRIAFVQNLVMLTALLVCVFYQASIEWFAGVYTGTRLLGLGAAALTAKRLMRLPAFTINVAEWMQVLKQGWSFGVHLVCTVVFFQIDTFLLSLWKGDHAVGIYQAVIKLVGLSLILPDVIINALLPVFARFHREDQAQWRQLGKLLNKTLLLLALPIALALAVYADPLIALLYGGEEFAAAVPIMRVAALIIILRFVLETYSITLLTSGRQLSRMAITMLVTAAAIALNIYVVPHYGAYGAAWVAVITNLLLALGLMLAQRSLFSQWTWDWHYLAPIAVTFVVGLILMKMPDITIWYGLPLALVVHGLVTYFIGYTKAERQMILARSQAPVQI